MANKRLDYDKIYELVMECRQSGLSDRQWCINHDIVPSTFYYWVRRLQERACYDIPGNSGFHNGTPAVAEKQDVVCINIQPEPVEVTHAVQEPLCNDCASVKLQYKDVNISLTDDFNEKTLKRILLTLQETLC